MGLKILDLHLRKIGLEFKMVEWDFDLVRFRVPIGRAGASSTMVGK